MDDQETKKSKPQTPNKCWHVLVNHRFTNKSFFRFRGFHVFVPRILANAQTMILGANHTIPIEHETNVCNKELNEDMTRHLTRGISQQGAPRELQRDFRRGI